MQETINHLTDVFTQSMCPPEDDVVLRRRDALKLLQDQDDNLSPLEKACLAAFFQKEILVSPVSYVSTMHLHGSLFSDNCNTGAVSSVNTSFYVDHEEPLEALAAYKASAPWVLGELLDGHEYLLILPASSTKPAANIFL